MWGLAQFQTQRLAGFPARGLAGFCAQELVDFHAKLVGQKQSVFLWSCSGPKCVSFTGSSFGARYFYLAALLPYNNLL